MFGRVRSVARRGKLVSREPIHEQILPHIRRDIVLNRWLPGERLPELDLCAEYGVSRTPLRDVLKILEVEGLVELQPHVGAVVTLMDSPDLAEKFEVMMNLEQAAAMTVAQLRSPAVLKEIQRLHRSMELAAKEAKIDQYYRLNDEFHRAIILGSANQTRARIHEILMSHVSRARNRANKHEGLTASSAEHHALIVQSILAGAAEAAGQAMREHLVEVTRGALSDVQAMQARG